MSELRSQKRENEKARKDRYVRAKADYVRLFTEAAFDTDEKLARLDFDRIRALVDALEESKRRMIDLRNEQRELETASIAE